MIWKNAQECFKHRPLIPDYTFAGDSQVIDAMIWFRGKVANNKNWDVKRKTQWEEQLPGVPYLGYNGQFALYGAIITAEDLGNIAYGYWGSATGFGPITLFSGGGFAKQGWEGYFSWEIRKPPFYGDDENDHYMIQRGIDWFNEQHPDLKPVVNCPL